MLSYLCCALKIANNLKEINFFIYFKEQNFQDLFVPDVIKINTNFKLLLNEHKLLKSFFEL